MSSHPGHRNNSSQMKRIFNQDDDKDESSFSSSSGPSCAGGVGGGAEGAREKEERERREKWERKKREMEKEFEREKEKEMERREEWEREEREREKRERERKEGERKWMEEMEKKEREKERERREEKEEKVGEKERAERERKWREEKEKEERESRRREERGEGSPSSCCSQSDLRTRSQTNLKELSFNETHTVLIDVKVFNHRPKTIVPQIGRDVWQSDFVKLPSSPRNHMTKSVMLTGPAEVSRWDVIQKQLKKLAGKKEVSVSDLEDAIMKYNPRYKGKWKFDALAFFIMRAPKEENYYTALFPKIAALALKLPEEVRKAVPLLRRGQTKAITLSQLQISCLLANAFFCTFPHRNATGPGSEYHAFPTINFNSLFWKWSDSAREKLRAIMHYFNVVTNDKTAPHGLVTFERRHLRDTDLPTWRSCADKLTKLHVTSHGSIEKEGTGMLQVDFACSRIGGGVLGSGLVQEEILFLMNPELIVSRLFTEELGDTECLVITGSQQFSIYCGYGNTFEWAGPFNDPPFRDEWQRRKRQIIAIDALNFKHQREQYSTEKIRRELNKAFCGFRGKEGDPDIATGKWGCGAFKGDPQLKALIQLMAAAVAKRGVAFFTFGDEVLKDQLEQIYHLLVTKGTTVDKLFRLLDDYCDVRRLDAVSPVELFQFIRNSLGTRTSHL